MEISYKVLIKIFFIVFASSLLISCDKEDEEPTLDTSLLIGKQWQLTKVTYNEKGEEVIDKIIVCRQDDAIEFKPDQIFTRYNGQNKCNQEADSQISQWSIFQEPKRLIFEDVEYQILELKQTNLDLQRELQGVDGKVIAKYYYTPK